MCYLSVKYAFFLFGSFLLVSGRSHHERLKRIIGGSNVEIEEVPYMLSLRLDGKHICGAVIIGEEWCLTAAHCCISNSNLTVQSGTANLDEGGDTREVTQVTRHELYRVNDDDYDLCALCVDEAFEFSNLTAPVKLPKPKLEETDMMDGSIAGWGFTEADGGTLSAQLQSINVTKVDLKYCKYEYSSKYTIHDSNVCYGSDNGWDDACQGDSGGPLVNRDSVLLGIVSFGDECGYSKLPGVYVDVVQFLEWIERTTGLQPE